MLPADRALTPRLLQNIRNRSWPFISARHRSTATPANRLSRRDFVTEKRWSRHNGKGPVRRAQHEDVVRIPLTTGDLAQRSRFLEKKTFIPWLIRHLGLVARTSEDQGFVTFARTLMSTYENKSIWRSLEKEEAPISKPFAFKSSEYSHPVRLLRSLQRAFNSNGEAGINTQLKYAYDGLLANRKFTEVDIFDQKTLADLRYPVEWYPATREIQRTIHLHVGPTNSGKTYHALKRLEQARSGIYAGPLRLLAHEVFTRLNTKGIACDLLTGDERVVSEGEKARMKSCTVEMVPLNTDVDIAVIDEIQMIGHKERGWAWTQALLGLKAKELHLCGEERTMPLIRELVASMGDELEVHTYKRLSPLKTMSSSLQGRLSALRKGDCVVVFSKVGIHAMKRSIEQTTQKRVAVVYGSLPPEIRAQQAKLFNDPDNDYDILVASDAIGMGLNLAIKRIIFETATKFNGSFYELIGESQIKQIAGRAGRFRTSAQTEGPASVPNEGEDDLQARSLLNLPAPNLGLVTTLEDQDLPIVRKAMQNEAEPIMTAGIFPPTSVLIRFASYFPPSTSFSYILLRLQELSLLHPRFHMCELKDQIGIADIIQPFRNLTTHDRIVFCAAPAPFRHAGIPAILAAYSRCVADNSSGALLDIPELPLDVLGEEVTPDRGYMARLESLHKVLILYLWLSYRFAGVFVSQAMAFHVKRLVEGRIDKVLRDFSSSPAIKERIRKMREAALRQARKMNEKEPGFDESQAQTEELENLLVSGISSKSAGDAASGMGAPDSSDQLHTSKISDEKYQDVTFP